MNVRAGSVRDLAQGGGAALAVVAGVGLASLVYARWEARQYTLRRVRVTVANHHPERCLPDLRILHLSDLHLSPRDLDRAAWVRSLADLRPDLVVATGDFHGSANAAGLVLEALGDLRDIPGLYVRGSNDYFAPTPSNPLRYFAGPTTSVPRRPPIDAGILDRALLAGGWRDLDNQRTHLEVRGWSLAARGTDDPHIKRDKYHLVAGPYAAEADLRLGVTHAPYRRVLDGLAADNTDLMMAGHTHGGQICLPWYGAMVTNCDLPRQQVKGLSSWDASALHVSAGLGTNPYAAIRFACRPEATLLTVTRQGS